MNVVAMDDEDYIVIPKVLSSSYTEKNIVPDHAFIVIFKYTCRCKFSELNVYVNSASI